MSDPGVVILGIPLPSSSPTFLVLVAIHVLAGIVSVFAGLIAMLSRKGERRHIAAGTLYYWSLVGVFVTMSFLAVMRWPHDNHLFVLGALSMLAAAIGRKAQRRRWREGLRTHVCGMALSYIFMLTAFYVDNGPNLPGWRSLPPIAFWVGPALVGLPILLRVLKRHPLILSAAR